ncbi:MAG: hypothetical protein ACP5KN_21365, partial [Armatimonadota bacterium]
MKIRYIVSLVALVALVTTLALGPGIAPGRRGVRAQGVDDADDAWTEPVNLSRSGAASEPFVAPVPGGGMQAFWWDRFDGIMTALYDADTGVWSEPVPAPIEIRTLVGQGENAEVVVTPIPAMPHIVKGANVALAFWEGAADEETGLRPFLLSRMRLGTLPGGPGGGWTAPDEVSEAVSAWALAASDDDTLHLVYTRPVQSATFPAGLYYKRSTDGGATWSAPEILMASLYYRLYTADQLHLTTRAAADQVYVAWDDPRLGRAFWTLSKDTGETWADPMAMGPAVTEDGGESPAAPALTPGRPRWVPALETRSSEGAEVALLWEAANAFSGCELYQQTVITRSVTTGDTPVVTDTLAAPVRVLPDLRTCPAALRAVAVPAEAAGEAADEAAEAEAGTASLLIAGEGTDTLTVVGRTAGEDSLPKALSFSFEDPETGARLYLEDLHATVTDDGQLVVVGATGAAAGTAADGGDVWALHTEIDALDLAFAPPPLWSEPVAVSDGEVAPDLPALTLDAEGRLHALWREPGRGLTYARLDGDAWSRPTQITQASEGEAADPVLVVLGDRLHAFWREGALGGVAHSMAYIRDAVSGGWSEPTVSSAIGAPAGAPDVTVDANGTLHLVVALPLNEDRGILYMRSTDEGATWSDPVIAFDAAYPEPPEQPWPMVSAPSLAIDGAGNLHVAFVRGSADGPFPPDGVYHIRSTDGGETWSTPALIAESGFVRPMVVAPAGGQVMVLYQASAADTVAADGRQSWSQRVSTDYGVAWGYQQFVPGFQDAPGPVSLVPDAEGGVTLVGLARGGLGAATRAWTLQASTWTGDRWSPWESDELTAVADPLPGLAAALDGEAGRLHALYRAQGMSAGAAAVDAAIADAAIAGAAVAAPVLVHTARDVAAVATA